MPADWAPVSAAASYAIAPSSPLSGEDEGADRTCRPLTHPAARPAATHAPWPASARAATPVLLALAAEVVGPPPKEPSLFCCAASQPVAFAIAAVTLASGLPSAASWSTARAVTSVSGALPAASPSTQPWAAAAAGAKSRRK